MNVTQNISEQRFDEVKAPLGLKSLTHFLQSTLLFK